MAVEKDRNFVYTTANWPVFTYLVVLVEPEKGEVGDAYRLPVILDLLARAVDDVGHLVRHHELQVLSRKDEGAREY